jgi:hypothetical protein
MKMESKRNQPNNTSYHTLERRGDHEKEERERERERERESMLER